MQYLEVYQGWTTQWVSQDKFLMVVINVALGTNNIDISRDKRSDF